MLEYWNQEEVESMYDKHLIRLEIALIVSRLSAGSKILDAGCGEGEGTAAYAAIAGVSVDAVDFSDTRLAKARARLGNAQNVTLKKVDFLGKYDLPGNYDFIVSQRFLINLTEWRLQAKVLRDLMMLLKIGGKLLLLEGSADGVAELNEFRRMYGLGPIPVRWHNLFFQDEQLLQCMSAAGCELRETDGFGEYFLLTRGIRPYFDKALNWDSDFNALSACSIIGRILRLGPRCSRLKLWVFERVKNVG